ncbi:LacI family transcriptional regulator [Arthrobacter silviterrae]|uniref:LacI family transcriptional regulator n=1 Tax=Arthrobacter silviterrae TaxID=2026658 RepID=A0ABX0DAM3_9MICC|nr:LacI family DNA-binding transcriptional regulator [Arthrobacter silviterrae]MDQ0278798.1 LacI family transcriptional regulator [Arthrobacter silviterrae]NGN83967.1 LacI family transcriptional regulator [Arthrobacter silviterrae]
MATTLKEVAAAAGVSLATASRAFKDADLLAPKTRQRVLDAAVMVGYDAPLSSRSKTIGVIVPDIANSVYAALIKSIQHNAWPGRHRMLLADTNEDPAREVELIETVGRTVDGLIICSPRSEGIAIKQAVGQSPAVVINGQVPGAVSILMDVRQGLRQAVEHLHALGHRRFVYVPGPAAAWANRTRLKALSELAEEWNMSLSTVGNHAASIQGGLAAAAAVTASGATAVVAYNDLVALGVESGIRSMGYSCPGDFSILGIDDLDIAAVSDPGLTSVRMAIPQSGALGLELILDLIDRKPQSQPQFLLESQLIVRRSTSAVAPDSDDVSPPPIAAGAP